MEFSDDGGSMDSIPTRPMRVKVLYTFDAENKTQCLARLQDTLNIPVVVVDEQSHVGVIDLQQCIHAMLSASPEILSKLETGDFTVYNFDFTEQDAPLVGQGRLSSLLDGSQGNGKTNIIGRVCKNIQAMFSNGVKEILEVKFRLTPLSRPAHGELGRSTEALRSSSPATSSGFDPNAWRASMQQNKVPQQTADYFNFDALAAGGDNGAALLEDMFGMGSGATGDVSGLQQPGGVGVPETPTDSAFAYNPAFSAQSHSAPGSRAGSPIMRPRSSTHNEQIRHHSFSTQPPNFTDQNRPGSRASVRSETNTTRQPYPMHTQPHPQQIHPQAEVHYNEDGQPRKRAKVTQTDWRGKSSFGGKSSDLRVTAATASSMHMHRPIAKRPSAPGTDLEPPPRVPTPVPQRTLLPRQRSQYQSIASRSSLRQSTVDSDFGSDMEPMSDVMTSPEGSSPGNSLNADGTPMDIPSSPPLIPGFNQPAPSSPGLPTLPPARMADSGYMSERGFNSGTVMESLEDDENRSPDAEDMEMAAQYRARNYRQSSFVKTEGSVAGDLPYSIGAFPHSDFDAKSQGYSFNSAVGPRVSEAPSAMSPWDNQTPQPDSNASRRGSLALPPKGPPRASSQATTKVPTKQPRQTLHRSHTTSNASDAGSPAPSDTEGRAKGVYRHAPRRKIIEQQLQESIARGESPVFCVHCGAIETPTWRKLYIKEVEGKPNILDEQEGEGETVGIETKETNDDGEVIKFLIRKSMKSTKDSQPGPGFEQVVVCNPCGLWFKKFRNMRPSDRWHRKPSQRKAKKPKTDDNPATDAAEPQSEAFFTDQVAPEDAIEDSNSADDTRAGANAPPRRQLPPLRPRASSVQPQPFRQTSDDPAAQNRRNSAMMRDIQSSPVRTQGSQDSPIELDLTPQPTRRLLFPSPRRDGEMKSLGDGAVRGSASPKSNASGEKPSPNIVGVVEETTVDFNVFEAFTSDKENMAPPLEENDDLSHLFEGSPGAFFKTPLRKTPSKTPLRQELTKDLLKTPTPSSRKRKPLTPSQNAANNADMNMDNFLTSPSQSRYFLRSTPSRLERTPGGRSISGGHMPGDGVSPFSRHLAQMLSDANGMEAFTSPSRQYDFSDMPTFTSPGRDNVDWKGLDEILNSDFATYDDNGGTNVDSQQMGGQQ